MQNVSPPGRCQHTFTYLSAPFGIMGGYILGAWTASRYVDPESDWVSGSGFFLAACFALVVPGLCSGIRQPLRNMNITCTLPFVAAHNLASILTQCGLVRAEGDQPLLN
ncbi:MAG: hypothetical protein NTV32_04295 [Gammaproteobacteria bacterium]|nr:hypothetical protein [Gammaproteobacteria bacterium]